jgi:hypothetical protein
MPRELALDFEKNTTLILFIKNKLYKDSNPNAYLATLLFFDQAQG